jgi:hypothetical protein
LHQERKKRGKKEGSRGGRDYRREENFKTIEFGMTAFPKGFLFISDKIVTNGDAIIIFKVNHSSCYPAIFYIFWKVLTYTLMKMTQDKKY